MALTIPLSIIELTPGSTVSIHNLSWRDFEMLLTDLGEERSTRVAYYKGALEIMSPLARHERHHRIIADIVKALLDRQGQDWEDFGSTTLKRYRVHTSPPRAIFQPRKVASNCRRPRTKVGIPGGLCVS
jgi:Uma2 family endonuclease